MEPGYLEHSDKLWFAAGIMKQVFDFPHAVVLVCRSKMGTWFVCGSWLENASLNMPPPSATSQTARDFAGQFPEERHVSWSTATTRSLIFRPYPSQLCETQGYGRVIVHAKKNYTWPKVIFVIWLDFCIGVTCIQVIFLIDLHLLWWGSTRKSKKNVAVFLRVVYFWPSYTEQARCITRQV